MYDSLDEDVDKRAGVFSRQQVFFKYCYRVRTASLDATSVSGIQKQRNKVHFLLTVGRVFLLAFLESFRVCSLKRRYDDMRFFQAGNRLTTDQSETYEMLMEFCVWTAPELCNSGRVRFRKKLEKAIS